MTHRLNGSQNGHAPAPSRTGKDGDAPAPLPPSADGPPPAGKDPATGRFLPGNRCGRGNPHYRKLAANRTAFLEAVGPEQVKALAAQLLARALAGDVDAARLVLAYAVGRPQPAADPDDADAAEWRARREWPIFADLLGEVPKIPLGEALDMVQWLWQQAQPVPLTLPPAPEGAKPGA
jgi:hypothetical protein